jgi:outer membrane protein TolC
MSIQSALSSLLVVFLAATVCAQETPLRSGATVREERPFAGAAQLDRRALLAEVVRRNPTLEAARLAWKAAAARPSQEAFLPNPMLSFGAAPASFAGSGLRFGQQIELSQDFTLPARRRLRAGRATAEASGAAADFCSTLLDLLSVASQLYDDDYLASRSLAVVAQHRALLAELQRVATARYAAGLAPQLDLLQAELESAKVLHRQVELEAERGRIASRLTALLHLPEDYALPPPVSELPIPSSVAEFGALSPSALAERPEVAARASQVDAQRASVALARLAGVPDLSLHASYDSMWDERGYRWMAGVAISLPIRQHLASQQAEAEARLARAQAELAATEDRIRAEVRSAVIGLQEAHHLLTIFASRMLPAARDQVQAARSGYETGRGNFLGVIDAERSLRDVELGQAQAVADFYRKQADLDRAVGRLPDGLPATLLEPATEPPCPLASPLDQGRERGTR